MTTASLAVLRTALALSAGTLLAAGACLLAYHRWHDGALLCVAARGVAGWANAVAEAWAAKETTL